MGTEQSDSSIRTSWRTVAAAIVLKVIFPIWVGTGSIFKLINGGPSTLPVVLVKGLGGIGVDLMFVLGLSISVELTIIGLVWIVPRLGRLAVVALLSLFLAILVADIWMGAASCGCFGSIQLSPWFTLIVDGLILAAVLWIGGGRQTAATGIGPWLTASVPLWRVAVALGWSVAAFAAVFGLLAHQLDDRPEAAGLPGAAATQATLLSGGTSSAGATTPVPPYYLPEYDSWTGRAWSEIDLAGWVRGATEGLDAGTWYVLLYRKDCEHCHELLEVYFSGELTIPTLAIAVPEKQGFPTTGVLPMPCVQCRLAELPAGCDWFLATPVLLRLQDGVIECAAEVDPAEPECLQW